MKKLYSFIYFICFSLLLGACIDAVNLPIRDESGKLVVEGLISNAPPPYTIILSTSVTYESGSVVARLPNPLSGVSVAVLDDMGNREVFKETINGQYKNTANGMRGQVGRSYQLEVIMPDGRKFVSIAEKLMAVSPIDSVTSEYSKVLKGHSFYVNTHDPRGERNYYRWTTYGIGSLQVSPVSNPSPASCSPFCWQYIENKTLNLLSDEFIDGNQIQKQKVFFAPYVSQSDFYLEVNQSSISKDAFRYLQLLEDQRNRTGSIFDPPPASILGNIYNANDSKEIALGYFIVSGVSRKRIIIKRTGLSDRLPMPIPLAFVGKCCDVYFGTSQAIPPWRD
ncbi:MAG: DUF4249 domain-containing protein [Cytophagales bacterium]|nr:MAG: DUF4249 domain-containing protein [Cytophagales bacterium]